MHHSVRIIQDSRQVLKHPILKSKNKLDQVSGVKCAGLYMPFCSFWQDSCVVTEVRFSFAKVVSDAYYLHIRHCIPVKIL